MSRLKGAEGEDHDDREAGAVAVEGHSPQRARRFTKEFNFRISLLRLRGFRFATLGFVPVE